MKNESLFLIIPFGLLHYLQMGIRYLVKISTIIKSSKIFLRKAWTNQIHTIFQNFFERFNKNDPSLSNKEIIALQIGFTADKKL
ncbi:MAG: hypothetical protein IPL09_11835 [Bacteroidetes bacterium]|nr:hypothetical protein [Bacteroidota bacterium]